MTKIPSPLDAARLLGRTLVGAVAGGTATFVLTAILSLPVSARLVMPVRHLESAEARAVLGGVLSTAAMWLAAPLVAAAFTRLTDMKPIVLGVVQALVAITAVLMVDLVTLGEEGPLLGGELFFGSRLAGYALAMGLSVAGARFGAGRARAAELADDEARRAAEAEREKLLSASVALAEQAEARRAAAASPEAKPE